MIRSIRALALLALTAAPALAQPPGGAPARPRDRVSERAPAARPRLDQLAAIVQRRLGLTNEQAGQLRSVTSRVATERETLLRQERQARRTLRDELLRGDAADQQVVATQLDQMLKVQRRRVELVAQEQQELARFLTPVQRARFLALQERAFRAAQQLRARRELALDSARAAPR